MVTEGRGVHNDTDYSEGGQHEKAGGGGRDEQQQWDEAGWCERWSQKEAQSGEMPSTYDSPCAEALLSTGIGIMVRGQWVEWRPWMISDFPRFSQIFLQKNRGVEKITCLV